MNSNGLAGAEVSRRLSELGAKVRQTDILPDPEPLEQMNAPVEFPVDALPSYMADYCTGLAYQLQTPVDMPAISCLGVLAAAAGGRARVEARPGWREPLNLYLMLFSSPASRKSAVIDGPAEPLRRAERKLRDLVRPQHIEAATRSAVAKKIAEAAIKAAADCQPGDLPAKEQVAIEAQIRFESIKVPPLPTILSEDSTSEALVGLMVENNGRAAVVAAEADALTTMAGRYSTTSNGQKSSGGGGANLGVILKAHSGEPHKTRRVGRESEDLAHLSLTMMLLAQPSVLAGMVTNPEWDGRGLLARMLMSVPTETVGSRINGTEPVDDEVAVEYIRRTEELVLDLAGFRVTNGTTGRLETLIDEPDELPLLVFSPSADDLLLAFQNELEPQLKEDGRLGGIQGWGGKLPGAMVRIAGLLHLAEHSIAEPVSDKTVDRAWRIASYFIEHALVAFRQVRVTESPGARKVLEYLQKEKLSSFSVRSVHHALCGARRFHDVVAVTTALDVLEEKGWVIKRQTSPRPGPGRKPSPVYDSHPKIL